MINSKQFYLSAVQHETTRRQAKRACNNFSLLQSTEQTFLFYCFMNKLFFALFFFSQFINPAGNLNDLFLSFKVLISTVPYIKGPVNSQGLLFKNYRFICTDS